RFALACSERLVELGEPAFDVFFEAVHVLAIATPLSRILLLDLVQELPQETLFPADPVDAQVLPISAAVYLPGGGFELLHPVIQPGRRLALADGAHLPLGGRGGATLACERRLCQL